MRPRVERVRECAMSLLPRKHKGVEKEEDKDGVVDANQSLGRNFEIINKEWE